MGMEDPIPTYTYLVSSLRDLYPDLAYIHAIEDFHDSSPPPDKPSLKSNSFLRDIWAPRPFISAGGYSSAECLVHAAESTNDIIAVGRFFISNVSLSKHFLQEAKRHSTYIAI